MSIPKIIHQTAPEDKCDWHPIWEKCHLSWKEQFPESEYQHVLWNDNDIDSLIKNNYPQYRIFYEHLPFHIMKIDFAKFCILHEYGGIYADMDMYCYKNFYSDLKEEYYLVGSFCDFEIVQNSLMASTSKNNFLKYYIDSILVRYKPFPQKITAVLIDSAEWCPYVIKTTGPKVLGEIFNEFGGTKFNILPPDNFNNYYLFYDEKLKTRHMLTGRWGKDSIGSDKNILKQYNKDTNNNMSYEQLSIQCYKNNRKIDIGSFDFYKNYIN